MFACIVSRDIVLELESDQNTDSGLITLRKYTLDTPDKNLRSYVRFVIAIASQKNRNQTGDREIPFVVAHDVKDR